MPDRAARSPAASRERPPPYSAELFGAILIFVAAIRLFVIEHNGLSLSGDEAQYWIWSQTPALGYYSKPPLIAWAIRLSTGLFGDTEFGVRFFAPVFHAVTAFVIFRIGRRLFDTRTGFWAGLAYATLPAVSLSSLLISTDAPLLMFWALGLWCLIEARDSGAMRWWIRFGLALGLGALAKYAMLLILPGIALYGLLADRDLLRRRGLWIGLAIGLVVLAPNLVWNAANGFVTFQHTEDNANLGAQGLRPDKLAEFLGSQAAVIGPFLLLALPFAVVAAFRRDGSGRARGAKLLASLALPPLLFMSAIALVSRAHPNWAATAYVSGVVLIAAWALAGDRVRWRRLVLVGSVALHGMVAMIAIGYRDAVRLAGVTLPARFDPARKLTGLPALGRAVAEELAQRPGTVLLTVDRGLFAQLAFYVRPRPDQAQSQWSDRPLDQFQMTNSVRARPDARYLYVAEDAAHIATGEFRNARPVSVISIPIAPGEVHRYELWEVWDLKRR